MRVIASWILAACIAVVPAWAAPKPKPKRPTVAQLQAQIKQLTSERDDLKDRLAATEGLQQDLASAQQGRDLARQEADGLRKELTAIKASLNENQSGSDAILKELQKTKADLAASTAANEDLKQQLGDAQAKLKAESVASGSLSDIVLARPMNLNRVTPKVRHVSRGVVVVNVLIDENGDVLNTRLIQGLPGSDHDLDVQKANGACLEAAKRIVFDPARASDGTTKIRVWQAVGFLID
jgi:hypothetical protein